MAWGSYTVPFKLSQSSRLIQFQALMGLGILASGFFLSLILGYPLNLNVYGLISGFLWAVANAISLVAILSLGISKAVPIISSLVILSSFLWGLFYFKEITQPQKKLQVLMGAVILVMGVIILGLA